MKKKVAIVFSDLHLNIWAKFNENHKRTLDGFKVLDTIAEICTKERIPALFCGDLLHKPESIEQELAIYLKSWVNKCKYKWPRFKIFGIEGNHDLHKVNTVGHYQEGWFSYLATTTSNWSPFVPLSPTTPPAVLSSDIMVFGIPYIDHNTNLSQVVKALTFHKGFKNILLLHTDYPGAKDSDGRIVDSVENLNINTLSRFDLVLCGHIHKPQRLAKKVYMIGSPIQQRRTDRDCDMGYWELYEDLSMKFVPLEGFPKFIDVESADQIKDDGNYYTVVPPKLKASDLNSTGHKITKQLSKKKLAHRYMKQQGIKDKVKEELLVKTLKEAESC